jgi:hypothetical protein
MSCPQLRLFYRRVSLRDDNEREERKSRIREELLTLINKGLAHGSPVILRGWSCLREDPTILGRGESTPGHLKHQARPRRRMSRRTSRGRTSGVSRKVLEDVNAAKFTSENSCSNLTSSYHKVFSSTWRTRTEFDKAKRQVRCIGRNFLVRGRSM